MNDEVERVCAGASSAGTGGLSAHPDQIDPRSCRSEGAFTFPWHVVEQGLLYV